jgi:hypothetical protein
MTDEEPKSAVEDPVLAALIRAREKAWIIAALTGTEIVYEKDGELVYERPEIEGLSAEQQEHVRSLIRRVKPRFHW